MHVIIKIHERSAKSSMCNKYMKEVIFKHYLVLISIYTKHLLHEKLIVVLHDNTQGQITY